MLNVCVLNVCVCVSHCCLSTIDFIGHNCCRTKKFLDLLWTNQHSKDVGVNDFLTSLSPVLSTEIKLSLYLKKITSTPFFQTCGREVLIALSNCVNTRVYMAGDRIVRRGEYGSWMAFIAKGSVSVIVPNNRRQSQGGGEDGDGIVCRNEKEVAVLREGAGGYFGEMALLYDKPRNATIEARSWLRIHQLHRVDFHRVFNLYPNEKIKMNAVINKMKVFKKVRTRSMSGESVVVVGVTNDEDEGGEKGDL